MVWTFLKKDWKDREIINAHAKGVSMIDHSIMMQVLQMDQNCILST